MFPLILTVFNRDCTRGGAIIPMKDCEQKGEHPKFRV